MIAEQYPTFWRASPETMSLWSAFDAETVDLRWDLQDLIAQCFIETATWGLVLWERDLGLPTEDGKDLNSRRARSKAKLRSTGTVDIPMIKNVAESYVNGEVEIAVQPNAYHFDVIFVGIRGIPPNMDDLTAAIEEIRPAHLTYAYVYTYNTYADLAGHTYGQLAAYTHAELREGEFS